MDFASDSSRLSGVRVDLLPVKNLGITFFKKLLRMYWLPLLSSHVLCEWDAEAVEKISVKKKKSC
jgi:hypothetical protein